MRALLEVVGEWFAHLLASEFLRPVTEPIGRLGAALATRVQPLLTVPVLILGWLAAVGLMVLGWHLGTAHASALWTAIATLLWFGAPVAALTMTVLWYDRGRAA